jgi:hypothetical protein
LGWLAVPEHLQAALKLQSELLNESCDMTWLKTANVYADHTYLGLAGAARHRFGAARLVTLPAFLNVPSPPTKHQVQADEEVTLSTPALGTDRCDRQLRRSRGPYSSFFKEAVCQLAHYAQLKHLLILN